MYELWPIQHEGSLDYYFHRNRQEMYSHIQWPYTQLNQYVMYYPPYKNHLKDMKHIYTYSNVHRIKKLKYPSKYQQLTKLHIWWLGGNREIGHKNTQQIAEITIFTSSWNYTTFPTNTDLVIEKITMKLLSLLIPKSLWRYHLYSFRTSFQQHLKLRRMH